ncbi:MAG: aryl-sulfate sulfotransferase [Rikenellaceae bacterium]|nr:aryl-sulfate sulfotransferase [Rikenellaceae bacterium]
MTSLTLTTRFSRTQGKSIPQEAVQVALLNRSEFITDYSVQKDPNNVNPLSAEIRLAHPAPAAVRVTLKGQNDNDIVRTYPAQASHTIPVLGLYNRSDNQIEIELTHANGARLLMSEQIYCNLPYYQDITIQTRFAAGFRNAPDEFYLAASNDINIDIWPRPAIVPFDANSPVGYDQWGKVRMIYNRPGVYTFIPISYQGRKALAAIHNTEKFEIMDYTGEILLTQNFPDGKPLHHEVINIDDNTLAFGLAGVPVPGRSTDQYGLIEYDIPSGTFSNEIDLRPLVTRTRQLLSNDPDDIIHTNAIAYSKDDNCFIVSMRNQGVVKISRDTHRVIWMMTPHLFIGDLVPECRDRLLTPLNFPNAAEEWNIGQHSCTLLPTGDVMIFDNHNEPYQDADPSARYSRIVSFKVDDAGRTIEKVWNFHTPDKKFSSYMGSAYLQSNGNVLGCWPVQQYTCEFIPGTDAIQWESSFLPRNTRCDIYRTYKIQLE